MQLTAATITTTITTATVVATVVATAAAANVFFKWARVDKLLPPLAA